MPFLKKNKVQLPFFLKFFFPVIFVPAFFLILSIGFQVEANEEAGSSSESKSNYERLKVFSEVLSLIESTYVEKVQSEKLIEGAIHGLVKALDPHSSYLPPDAYQEMKVQTSGKFGGLGIEVSMRDGILTVISPIEGTPASKAGVPSIGEITVKMPSRILTSIPKPQNFPEV